MKTATHTKRTGARGFSLVEVTLAMAIAAVAIVTLLGLIPQGMDTMREAGDEAIQGRIHQQVLNELQMTPFESAGGGAPLDSYRDGKEFYYDAQGEELDESEKGSFAHIYTARVSAPSLGGGGTPQSVGGASFGGYSFDGSDANEFVRLVIVEVAPVAGLGKTFKFDDPEHRHLISTYQSVVVKMGQDYTP